MRDLSIGMGVLTLSIPTVLADLITWSDVGSQALLKWADATGLNDERTESLAQRIVALREVLATRPSIADSTFNIADATEKAAKAAKKFVAVDTSRWFLQFYSDLQRTIPQFQLFNAELEKLPTLEVTAPPFEILGESSARMAEALATNFGFVQQVMETLGSAGLEIFGKMAQAQGFAIAQAFVYSQSIGQAAAQAAKSVLAAEAGKALVLAIVESAAGFAALARLDFRGAALHFKSAALYGAVAGVAGGIGRALPSAQAAPAGAVPVGVAGPEGAAAGVLVGGREDRQGPIVNVIFEGPIYGGEAGLRELVADISEAVNNSDLVLHATSARKVEAIS